LPGTSETVRLDAIATALGHGRATSWPVAQARAELGLLADLFTRDQDVSAAKTRAALDWAAARTSIIAYLTARAPLSLPDRGASGRELSPGELVLEPLPLDVGVGDMPGEPPRVVPEP
jgi:hypothetical protein